MDQWSWWAGSIKTWTRSMEPLSWAEHRAPIFNTPYKQRPLVCLIAGSHLHVTLSMFSFTKRHGWHEKSKHCALLIMISLSFLEGFFILQSFCFFYLHVDEYLRNAIKMWLYKGLQSWKLIKYQILKYYCKFTFLIYFFVLVLILTLLLFAIIFLGVVKMGAP